MKKKLLNKVLIFISLFFFFVVFPNKTFADVTVTQNPPIIYSSTESITFTFFGPEGPFIDSQDYTFGTWTSRPTSNPDPQFTDIHHANSSTTFVQTVSKAAAFPDPGTWNYKLWLGKGTIDLNDSSLVSQGSVYVLPCANWNFAGCPALSLDLGIKTFQADSKIAAHIVNAQPDHEYGIWFNGDSTVRKLKFEAAEINEMIGIYRAVKIPGGIDAGGLKTNATLCLTEDPPILGKTIFGVHCDFGISGINITALPVPPPSINMPPIQSNEAGVPAAGIPSPLEAPVPSPPCSKWQNQKCIVINSAIGNISTDPGNLVRTVFSVVLGLAGGIALILIMISGYRFMTSRGNPEQVEAARDQLTSAIVGLLFIIFAFVILEVIGIDILGVPDFKKSLP